MTTRENQFSEGVALGVLMCQRDSLPNDKVGFELAFSRAFHSWSHKDEFPFVGGETMKDELWQMTHAGRLNHTHRLYWDGLYVQVHGDQALFASEVAGAIGPIPAEDWHELMSTAFELYGGATS